MRVLDFLVKPVKEQEFFTVMKNAVQQASKRERKTAYEILTDPTLDTQAAFNGRPALIHLEPTDAPFASKSGLIPIREQLYMMVDKKLTEADIREALRTVSAGWNAVLSDRFETIGSYRRTYQDVLKVSDEYLFLKTNVVPLPREYMMPAADFDPWLLDACPPEELLEALSRK